MKAWLGLGAALLLAACMERTPGTVAFSEAEAAFIKKPGTGVIAGHAFRTKASGTVVNAAGQLVHLIPATEFSRERFKNLFGKGKYLPHRDYPRADNPDPAYVEHMRTTKAEANGRFGFEGVAPGEYIVSSQVLWGDEEAFFREGGMVYDSVTVTGQEKEPVRAILSGN
ncbi:hypothetical protein [Bosea lathyri]|uniref:Carboxypeptidase regulatory-like domain-containing protein n=1 Tax=Bosea lathyri TaxID=1036778 RepID=A0A1H5YM49_9HYPH|nr:hypothetical protein [Bosea lathyri]SEG25221.1 hypothetical protein SAMN04488115_1043 [Bosea lathyri]